MNQQSSALPGPGGPQKPPVASAVPASVSGADAVAADASASDPAPAPVVDAAAIASQTRSVLEGLLSNPGRAFKLGFFLAVGVLTAWALASALGNLRSIIVTLVVALFVALGLQPVIEWLVKRGLPRTASAGLVTLALFAALILGLWAIVPLVIEQATTFADNAPAYVTELQKNPVIAQLDSQFKILDKVGPMLASGDWIAGAFGGFAAAGLAAANFAASTGLTTVLMLFFTFSAPQIKDAIYELAPGSKRPRVRYLASEIFKRIGDYLLSMLLVISLWGVLTFTVLTVMGLGKFAVALALLTMALTAIPAVGSFVAIALCGLIALSASPTAALVVAGVMLVYQQLDAYLVQPRLFARSLQVPPALVIMGVACGMALMGVLGALLAIPTVASLLLLYREVLVPKLDAS